VLCFAATPKYPIVLAHGLLGFSELQINRRLPNIEYWHGIRQALSAAGATVIAPAVPPSSTIEDRAAKLGEGIAAQARHYITPSQSSPEAAGANASEIHRNSEDGRVPVNIIAHSMGGLDARYMISHLLPPNIRVASLVTVATPHRGSSFADYVLEEGAGPLYLPRLYGLLERAGFGTGAFAQLTRRYMAEEFNPRTQDDPSVRYFSFGAAVDEPSLLSPFRMPHRVVAEAEGPNDGLVSVESSRWGDYRGTLLGVSHLDLINWSNRARWTIREWMGWERKFNAVALYLDIMDMLAKEKL
jgi:triacylglycerol lipase